MSNGDYDMTFRLYGTAVGGSPVWSEDQYVPLEDGIYNVELGVVNPLGAAFDQPLWLGISVEYRPRALPSHAADDRAVRVPRGGR